jgi:hypothetical protein
MVNFLAIRLDRLRVTAGHHSQIELLALSLRLKTLDALRDQWQQLDRVNFQTVCASLQAGVVQESVHQLEQAIASGTDVAEVLCGQRRQGSRQAAEQHVGIPQD